MGEKKSGIKGEKTKVELLKEHLLYAVGKYSDYSRYEISLASTEEYDETLELYNMDIWLGNSEGTIRDKAAAMLRVTTELFYDLADNAARELYYVMREIVELDEDSQKKICGVVIPKDIFTEKEFREMLSEWYEYEYVQEDALRAYLELLGRWEWGKNSIIPDKAERSIDQRLPAYIEKMQNEQSINSLEEDILQLIELQNEDSLNTNKSN